MARPRDKNQGPRGHQPAGTEARKMAKMARSHSTPAKRAITEQMSGSVEFDSPSVDTGLWRRWVSLLKRGSASLAVAKQRTRAKTTKADRVGVILAE